MRVITWNMNQKEQLWTAIVPQWLELYDVICIQRCGEPDFIKGNMSIDHGFETYGGMITNKGTRFYYAFCRVPYTHGRTFNFITLSRHPIEDYRIVSDPENSKIPSLGVTVKGFHIYNLHDFSDRNNSSPRVLEAIYEAHPNDLTLVVGDFNREPFSHYRWTLHYLASATRKNNKEFDYAFSRSIQSRNMSRMLIKHIPINQHSNFAVLYKLRKI